ncbi:class C beta-lactamase-related serine hydrolase [Sphingorhabdus pulchriflava]|uniref:Class C beta-lactamase-related serine hydrolase n=1 Tax=Sphingorhabdus pulchriflava TaxID=2292257 RepID=A0A371BJZ8_9SPHN|nr:serine hydrolase [Sphingorhabdus pulchriflava]RDV07887.1 class C beta-lactamase-related serine hydrolase [Sphingorhabdus pulchriflava]
MPRYKLPLGATAISLLLASCGGEAEPKPADTLPAIENIADDAAPGKTRLASTIAPFFEDPALEETRAIVIMHGGRVVAERYAPGYGPDSRLISWSMAKSVTATLIGMMVADGLLVLDDPAPVPEWSSPGDPRAKITLRQLLHMSSGLDHTEMAEGDKAIYEADTTRLLFLDGRENVARYAEKRNLEAEPGRHFEYSTATSHILADIMTRTLTDSSDPVVRRNAMLEYARGRLFEPLGMTSAVPEFDRSGTMLGGSMIHATARDWAKFGEFLRNNGSVRSAQLLPTSWTRFMKMSSANDPAYGGHLWLNKRRPEGRDQVLFPGKAPSDVFAALGHLGQFVVVSPQHRLTIVRLGKTQDDQLDPINDQIAKLIAIFPKS